MKKRTALQSAALAVVIASVIAVCGMTPAYAASAGISPNSQAKTSGSVFGWSVNWSGGSTQNGTTFTTGDGGTFHWFTVSGTQSPTHQLLTCSPPVVFHQALTVRNSSNLVVASATSTATATAGGFC